MFNYDVNLSIITCYSANIGKQEDWLANTTTGLFKKRYDVEIEISDSGIPSTWTTKNQTDFLTFTSVGTTSTIKLAVSSLKPVLYYSTDTKTWTNWADSSYAALTIKDGESVYIYGDNKTLYTSSSAYTNFGMTGKIACYGNIQTLCKKQFIEDTVSSKF